MRTELSFLLITSADRQNVMNLPPNHAFLIFAMNFIVLDSYLPSHKQNHNYREFTCNIMKN